MKPRRYASRTGRAHTLGLGLLLLSTGAAAQLYKYQDEAGIWHFSDKPPPQQQSGPRPAVDGGVITRQQQVIIHRLGDEAAPIFEVSNQLAMPIELEFSAREMRNLRAEPPLPIRKVIAASSREPLTRFAKIDPDAPWSYAYATRFVPGDPAAEHLTGKPYLPPFPPRKEFTLSQAFEGEQSHKQHTLTRYAVDIPMPANSPVQAARSGTLVEIRHGKLSPQRRHNTFYLRVLHRDGTFGLYAHLDPGSVKLLEGMTVNRGQVLGRLGGNTASEQLPHLHFAVQKNTGLQLESIPFAFTGFDGTAQEPRANQLLRHPHPQ